MRDRIESAALAVPGVEQMDWVRLRPGGGRVLGEVGVKVSRTLPLEEVAAIKGRLGAALAEAAPGAELTLTANPMAAPDEKGIERVMTIAARLRVPVHHISIHQSGGRPCISLDMEVDARLTLAEAHELASRLESELRAEFGAETEVETHVEPLVMEEPTTRSSEWAVGRGGGSPARGQRGAGRRAARRSRGARAQHGRGAAGELPLPGRAHAGHRQRSFRGGRRGARPAHPAA